jgi:BirA family biotin operon repressor/biotin-[acetyl-CoA-carboxylase] ligase
VTSLPPLYRHEQVGSTLDLLHQLAESGAVEGTAVVAREQTAGRGSRGRSWHSPIGGLWLSWLCRPATPLAGEVLSLRVGLAVVAVLEQLGNLPAIQLKWPNDVLIGGRKVAGILCEARWQGGALGWIAEDVAASATRLREYCADVTTDSVLPAILQALESVAGQPTALSPTELAAFASRDWLNGRALREPVLGIARGITAEGALRVEQEGGVLAEVRSGSVVLAESSRV